MDSVYNTLLKAYSIKIFYWRIKSISATSWCSSSPTSLLMRTYSWKMSSIPFSNTITICRFRTWKKQNQQIRKRIREISWIIEINYLFMRRQCIPKAWSPLLLDFRLNSDKVLLYQMVINSTIENEVSRRYFYSQYSLR